jgi:hypothetical protein
VEEIVLETTRVLAPREVLNVQDASKPITLFTDNQKNN